MTTNLESSMQTKSCSKLWMLINNGIVLVTKKPARRLYAIRKLSLSLRQQDEDEELIVVRASEAL